MHLDNQQYLVEEAKKRGAKVVLEAIPGFGSGYLARVGHLVAAGKTFATEEAAWHFLLEYLCLYQPGDVVMTSSEFANPYTSEETQPRTSISRYRLEIRMLEQQVLVFLMERLYQQGAEPQDVRQTREGRTFADIGHAVSYIGDFIASFEGKTAGVTRDAFLYCHEEPSHERLQCSQSDRPTCAVYAGCGHTRSGFRAAVSAVSRQQ